SRPVLLRLHVRVDGRPFRESWEGYVKKRFDYADRDGDGVLDRDEMRQVPSAQALHLLVQGNPLLGPGVGAARLDEVDADGDGKVSLDELKDYYRGSSVPAVRLVSSSAVYGPGNGL